MKANFRKQTISRIFGALVLSASLLIAAVAQATPTVVHDPEGNVTHIYGLEVDSELYDVEFVYGRGDEVFGGIKFDFNKQDDALTAAGTVAVVLNSESTSVTTVGSPSFKQPLFNIPWQVNGSNVRVVRGEYLGGEWTAFVPSTGLFPGDALDYTGAAGEYSWAKFTAADAPPAGNQPPVAVPGGPYPGEVDIAINFDGSASSDPEGEIIAWLWKFGDGESASGEMVSHAYATDGVFNVTLEVTDEMGVTASAPTSAHIGQGNQPPLADAGGPYSGQAGVNVAFNGAHSSDSESGMTYNWEFGDGETGVGVIPTHVYAAEGEYEVILTVTDDGELSDDDFTTASISSSDQPPQTPRVITDPQNPNTVIRVEDMPVDMVGVTQVYDVDFVYGTSYEVYGPEVDQFDFTGGNAEEDAGAFMLSLNTVLNGETPVPERAGVPSENFYYIGLEFDDTSSIPIVVSLGSDWSPGLPTWGVCERPTCVTGVAVLQADQSFAYVVLTLSDSSGNPPPVANAGGPYTGTAGAAVDFDGSASSDAGGSIAAWVWQFGDGEIGFDETTSHTYDTDAVYPVTLWVIDDIGQLDSNGTTATVGVGNQPPVAVPGGPYSADVDADVTFDGSASSDPDGEIAYWIWNFGDGTLGAGEVVSHSYSESGVKNVTLAVVDSGGAASAVSTVAEIGVAPDQTFDDVPSTHWAYIEIEAVAAADITGGCDADNYCPNDFVTRASMAVFLERAMRGGDFVPPAPQGIFPDVPTDYWAAAFIEQLAADGITSGCDSGSFCPDDVVTRAQMAVFLEKAKEWPTPFVPPPATGTVFLDVPLGYWADAWIEEVAADGITSGCGGENYCPEDLLTRDAMAVFLTAAFGL